MSPGKFTITQTANYRAPLTLHDDLVMAILGMKDEDLDCVIKVVEDAWGLIHIGV